MWDIALAQAVSQASSTIFKVWHYDTVFISSLMILQTIFAASIIYFCTTFRAKLSLLLLYLRIFSVKQILRYLIYLGIAFNICLIIAQLILFSYFRSPRPGAAWDPKIEERDKTFFILVVFASFNMVLDLYILLLPWPAVLKLQLPLRKKIDLMVIFMTGIL